MTNKIKAHYAFILLGLFGCSSNPYEEQITKHIETTAKVVPIIESVTIDTTARLESYQEHWKEQILKRRESNKKFYQKSIDQQLGFLAEWKREFRNSKAYKDTARFYVYIKEFQNQIDSVEYETDPVYETYKELINMKSEFEYLTVKYKLEKNGVTLIGNFVAENKTNFDPTTLTLDKFIKDTYFDKILAPKAEKYLKEKK